MCGAYLYTPASSSLSDTQELSDTYRKQIDCSPWFSWLSSVVLPSFILALVSLDCITISAPETVKIIPVKPPTPSRLATTRPVLSASSTVSES